MTMWKKHDMLLHHPDPISYGHHVTLYFEGFDTFCKLVDTVEIGTEDTKFVTTLVGSHEDYHRDDFLDEMNFYLCPLHIDHHAIPHTRFYPDGCINLNIDGKMVVA